MCGICGGPPEQFSDLIKTLESTISRYNSQSYSKTPVFLSNDDKARIDDSGLIL